MTAHAMVLAVAEPGDAEAVDRHLAARGLDVDDIPACTGTAVARVLRDAGAGAVRQPLSGRALVRLPLDDVADREREVVLPVGHGEHRICASVRVSLRGRPRETCASPSTTPPLSR